MNPIIYVLSITGILAIIAVFVILVNYALRFIDGFYLLRREHDALRGDFRTLYGKIREHEKLIKDLETVVKDISSKEKP